VKRGLPPAHTRCGSWNRLPTLVGVTTIALLVSWSAPAADFTPFGAGGEGGSLNAQTFSVGARGELFEVDGFLSIAGLDLNGGAAGTSAQLSKHGLPSGLQYAFTASSSSDTTDVTLTYTFTNTSAGTFSDIRFFILLDAEIDQAGNTFFNEFGVVVGAAGGGVTDQDADTWEISEPGFGSGTIVKRVREGWLAGTNAVSEGSPDDVAMAIGFELGNLAPGTDAKVEILISEDDDVLGGLALRHEDRDPESQTRITLSGRAVTGFHLDTETIGNGTVDTEDGWYQPGESVTIAGSPVPCSYFSHWSGDIPGGVQNTNPITVVMDRDRMVIAHFVADTTPPTLIVPDGVVLEYPADTTPQNTGHASATEDHGPVSITYSDASEPGCGRTETITRTWTAVDACGNSVSAVQLIAVVDTTAPTITCPPDTVVECPGATGPEVTGWATATDLCSAVTLTYRDGGSLAVADGLVAHYRFDATNAAVVPDEGGNGNDLLVFGEPWGATGVVGQAFGFHGDDYAQVEPGADATLYPTNTPFALSVWIRTWSSGEALIAGVDSGPGEGYSLSLDLVGKVVWSGIASSDTNARSDVVLNDGEWHHIVGTWNGSNAVLYVDGVVQDSVPDPGVAVYSTQSVFTVAAGLDAIVDEVRFYGRAISAEDVLRLYHRPLGTCPDLGNLARTWTATDECGNSASCTQSIEVVDTTVPVLTVPPATSLVANAQGQASYTGPTAVAVDACDTNVTISSQPALPAVFTGVGDHAMVWTATDASGNSAVGTQTVTVVDTSAPTVITPPAGTLEGGEGAVATYTGPPATASDNIDTNIVITSDPALPATFTGLGDHTIVWTATDSSGNSASATQTVTLIDTTAPVLLAPPDASAAADAQGQVTYAGPAATTTDLCDTNVAVSSVPALPAVFTGVGDHTIVWTATDASGNSATATQTVTVIDTTAPVVIIPPAATLEAGAGCTATYTGPAATATDNTDTNVTITSDPALPATFTGLGDHMIVWTATDSSGNSASATQTVTLADTTAPVLVVPPDVSLTANAQGEATYTGPAATATDLCDTNVAVSSQPALPATFAAGEHAIMWTAADDSGNSSVATQTVTVTEHFVVVANANGPYTGGEGADIQFSIAGSSGKEPLAMLWQFGDGTTSTNADPVHSYGDNGAYTAVLVVTDARGLSATNSAQAAVTNIAPVLDTVPDMTLDEDDHAAFSVPFADAGRDDTFVAVFDWGDGLMSTGTVDVTVTPDGVSGNAESTHAWALPGVYAVTLTVGDDDGGAAQGSFVVTVQDAALPLAQLVYPAPLFDTCAWVTGVVDIIGIAHDLHPDHPKAPTPDNFKCYSLFVASGKNSTTGFTAIVSGVTSNVIEPDLLGSWDATATQGWHTLLLAVEEKTLVDGTTKPNMAFAMSSVYAGTPTAAYSFGADDLNKPSAVAVRETEEGIFAYVADRNNDRVVVYELTDEGAELIAVKEIESAKKGKKGDLNKPGGLMVLQDDSHLVVADSNRKRLIRIDLGTDTYEEIGTGVDWKKPTGVTVGPDGALFVADSTAGRIVKLTPEGEYDADGTAVYADLDLNKPHGLHVDADGVLYVVDRNNNRILVVDTDGTPIESIGEDVLEKPMDIEVGPCGTLAVADRNHDAVVLFDASGASSISMGRDELNKPEGLAFVESKGWLVTVDRNNDRLVIWSMIPPVE